MIGGGGFWGKIGSGLSALTGGILGSGPSSYVDPNLRKYGAEQRQGIVERNKLGNKPLTGASGVGAATAGFNLKPFQQATQGLGQASKFEGYNPYQFSFKGLPKNFEQQAYDRAAIDLRREGAGNLAQLRNEVGNRRVGLLAKLGQDQQRQLAETLGKTRTDLALQRMQQDVELGKAQQLAQADENRATLGAQAGERRARLGALSDVGARQAGLQSDLLERERSYRDKGLDYLMDAYNAATGQSQNRVANANARRSATISGVAQVAGAAAGRPPVPG